MSLVDAAGVKHGPAGSGAAVRILSLVPSLTELVCALGLRARLVGCTRYCVHPADALRDVPRVGGPKKVRLDRVRELAPTHVLVNVDENPRELAEAVAALGARLIVTHPAGPEDNPPLYRLVGGIFGAEGEAEVLCARFDAALAAARQATAALPRRRVLYLIWRDPWMTVARETYTSRMLAAVGLDTVPAVCEARYPEVALHAALLADVDVALLSSEPYAFTAGHVAELEAAHPALTGRVHLIDGEAATWYGPRAITGIETLAALARSLDG